MLNIYLQKLGRAQAQLLFCAEFLEKSILFHLKVCSLSALFDSFSYCIVCLGYDVLLCECLQVLVKVTEPCEKTGRTEMPTDEDQWKVHVRVEILTTLTIC